jgi:hypothetical protein
MLSPSNSVWLRTITMSAASNMMMAKNHHHVGCEQHFFWQYLTITGSSATIFGATQDCL